MSTLRRRLFRGAVSTKGTRSQRAFLLHRGINCACACLCRAMPQSQQATHLSSSMRPAIHAIPRSRGLTSARPAAARPGASMTIRASRPITRFRQRTCSFRCRARRKRMKSRILPQRPRTRSRRPHRPELTPSGIGRLKTMRHRTAPRTVSAWSIRRGRCSKITTIIRSS